MFIGGIQPVKKVGGPSIEEEKKEAPKTGLFTTKPSSKFTSIKTSDPFAAKTNVKKYLSSSNFMNNTL